MSLEQLREDVQRCTACGLHEITDRAVFGEGSARSQVMFVWTSILRARDEDARQEAYRAFVDDLRLVAGWVAPAA